MRYAVQHAWKGSIEWPLPLRRGSRARGGVCKIAPPRVGGGGPGDDVSVYRSEMERNCHLLGLIIFTITTLNSSIKGMTVFGAFHSPSFASRVAAWMVASRVGRFPEKS